MQTMPDSKTTASPEPKKGQNDEDTLVKLSFKKFLNQREWKAGDARRQNNSVIQTYGSPN